jgi:hypothetical protein
MMKYDAGEIRELLNEYPEYPLFIYAGQGATDGDGEYTLCTVSGAEVGEFLDYEIPELKNYLITDRDEFEQRIEAIFYGTYEGDDFDRYVNQVARAFDPYWKKCILLTVDN